MTKTVAIALWIAFGFSVAALAIVFYTDWLADAQNIANSVLIRLQNY